MYITRRSEPTKLDHAPKGTRCRVIIMPDIKNGSFEGEARQEIYIQRNSDEADPIWERIEINHK